MISSRWATIEAIKLILPHPGLHLMNNHVSCPVSETPIARLTECGARISVEEGEHIVEIEEYGVIIALDTSCEFPRILISSSNHEPIELERYGIQGLTQEDLFWVTAEIVLDECERVGDWIVGQDKMAYLNTDPDESENSHHDEDERQAFRAFSSEQRRQRLRVTHPLKGIEMQPPDPESYYPWVRPLDRPILYAYDTSRDSIDCPVCGEYGRKSDFESGIACKAHGGFIVCHLSSTDDWVRTDVPRYKQDFLEDVRNQQLERVKVVRGGQIVTLVPTMGGHIEPRDIRKAGYDIPSGPYTEIPGTSLWKARTLDDENHIFSQHEVLAAKFREDSIAVEEKKWANGTSLHEGMRDYYQHASVSPSTNITVTPGRE